MAKKDLESKFWTVALVPNDKSKRETFFGLFTLTDAQIALDSGKIKTQKDEHLELRHIRLFPN